MTNEIAMHRKRCLKLAEKDLLLAKKTISGDNLDLVLRGIPPHVSGDKTHGTLPLTRRDHYLCTRHKHLLLIQCKGILNSFAMLVARSSRIIQDAETKQNKTHTPYLNLQ